MALLLKTYLLSDGAVQIREVSIDAPNHGDAAVLNEYTLQWGYHPICTPYVHS